MKNSHLKPFSAPGFFLKFFSFIFLLSACSNDVTAQQNNSAQKSDTVLKDSTQLKNQDRPETTFHDAGSIAKRTQVVNWMSHSGLIPDGFFEKEPTQGSPYFSSSWMSGAAILNGGSVIPKKQETLYFNYDKSTSRLYVTDTEHHVRSYASRDVNYFVLTDGSAYYVFEKVPGIAENFFLEPLVTSDKGYELYRRVITKITLATFSNTGYYTSGKKFDEYVDFIEYYLKLPDNSGYEKFPLRQTEVRKAFRDTPVDVNLFLTTPLTEQCLIGITQALNKP